MSEIEVANDGTVYVGGEYAGYSYTTTGFVVAGVGNTWTQLGAPLVGTWPGEHNPGYGSVWTVRPDVDGSIVAGGFFRQTEGHPVKSLAKWNGLTWAPYLGDVIGTVTDIERARDGSLLVLGGFDSIGTVPVHNAARVSGQTISGFGRGPTRSIRRLLEMPDGQIITGGDFLSELGQNAVESWNGAEWVPLGRGTNGRVDALAQLKSGEVVAAGTFTMIEGFSARNVARYDGSKWRPVGTGFDDYIWDICELPGGGLVAGGDFAIAGDVRASAIARWNGTEWQSMGGGLTGASLYGPSAYAVRALPNGDVIAGGDFTQAGGVPASFVARWDGAAWHPMGGGLAGRVLDLKLMPDRSVLAAGEFSGGVSRWNGSSWAPFGGGLPGVVRKLLVMRSGDVVAAGSFGGFIARFDGEWNAIPGGFDYILTLAELPGGRFAGSGWDKVRVWTSTGFSDLSEDPYDVFALLVTRDGKLMVGGNFEGIGSQPAAFLARYGCPCYPNCDNSAAAPSLNVNDLMCFVNSFARRDAYADCDGNGLILASDFLCYLSRFSSGCE